MALKTYKYVGSDPFEIPSLDIRVGVELSEAGDPVGTTFSVPEEFAARFDAEPEVFVPSRVRSPDVVPDVGVVAAVTGSIPVVDNTAAAV